MPDSSPLKEADHPTGRPRVKVTWQQVDLGDGPDAASGRLALVQLRPGPGEPVVASWHEEPLRDFVPRLRAAAGPATAPVVVAIDGRSGGGKTTLAERLAAAVPRAALLRIDDVAWYAPMFRWADLLIEGVLHPIREGAAVSYRPPAWVERGRSGAIEVPGGIDMLIVEGVGAGCRELADLIDVLIWVQSDFLEAERRGIARDIASGVNGDAGASRRFWHSWMAEEVPFLERDRPWDRATFIVAGTRVHPQGDGSPSSHDQDHVVLGSGWT